MNSKRIDVKKFGFEGDDVSPVTIGLDLLSTGLSPTDQKIIVCASLNRVYIIDFYSGNLINSFRHYQSDANECIPQRVDFCLTIKKQILAAALYVFKNEIKLIKLVDVELNEQRKKETFRVEPARPAVGSSTDDYILTVFPTLSLLKNSPLNEEIKAASTEKPKILSIQDYLKLVNICLIYFQKCAYMFI